MSGSVGTVIGILVVLGLIAVLAPGGIFVLAIGVIALLIWAGTHFARRDTTMERRQPRRAAAARPRR